MPGVADTAGVSLLQMYGIGEGVVGVDLSWAIEGHMRTVFLHHAVGKADVINVDSIRRMV